MKKKERLDAIAKIAQREKTLSVGDILHISENRTKAYRDLQQLIVDQKIKLTEKKGVYEYIVQPREYLERPFFKRKKVLYSPDFLRSYTPNKTFFLNKKQRKEIEQVVKSLPVSLDTNYYENNKRVREKALIDLSFASSSLEGNTYSHLDTEVLIKYAEVSKKNAQQETQMILNHKACIEYLIHQKNNLPYTSKSFAEIQTLLGKDLLHPSYLGSIRGTAVDIGGSTYVPLSTKVELEAEFSLFIEKLRSITNPREQSLFVLVFVPYFQAFMDINKRTSRMMANLPLLKNNLPLISLLSVEKKEYITAILAIYELQDTSLLSAIYTENYTERASRYSS